MEKSEENDIKIANYLEHKMTAEEEESFMVELGVNEGLQEQYEKVLFIHSLLSKDDERNFSSDDQLLQPADDHINMLETSLKNTKQKNETNPIIKLFSNYKNVAAALLIIISGSVVYLLGIKNLGQKGNVAEARKAVISNSRKDSSDKTPLQPIAVNINSDSIFKKFYRPYSSENDPVEISNYYIDYKKEKYAEIISAKEADYLVMGSNEKAAFLKQYMQLYKGLTYLAENKPIYAIRQFDTVLEAAGKKDPHYYEAQWYQALALIKINEISKAIAIATIISKSRSPYRFKAALLAKELY